MILKEALSYDDVLLIPKKSNIFSRKDVNTSSQITKKIKLNVPFISANMDTITEHKMAITMARHGGIGIIHRFMPIEKEVEQIKKVKRSESIIIETPLTLTSDKKLKDVKDITTEHGISGVLITENRKLKGILTSRDMIFEKNLDKRISEIMTKDVITAKYGISIEDAREILEKNKIEKLPLIDEEGNLRGLITTKDIQKKENYPKASKDQKGRLLVGASVGAIGDYIERAAAIIDAGVDIIVIDIAHGHSDHTIKAIKEIKKQFGDIQIMAGNVATPEATTDLIAAGADCIKVGIGPGSACTTRIVTGAGVPQLTAVMNCTEAANDIPILADGGLKNSGDITKALAAGASCIFSGLLFSGTDECPGSTLLKNGRRYKVYRGSAGYGTALARKQINGEEDETDVHNVVPEGVESIVPYKGPLSEVIFQLVGGLRSGMSYCGAETIRKLRMNSEFVKITNAGMKESHHHDIGII
ncbi:IMP dehydrogenase [Candidatus Aenigmatarchaeota archaeon]